MKALHFGCATWVARSAQRGRRALFDVLGVWLAVGWALSLALGALPFAAKAAGDPGQGPGGPILVLTSSSASYGKYYAEILRTEGLNAFAVADINTITATTLAAYDVVLLAKMPLAAGQVTLLSNWVNSGGNLIAMAPDTQLNGLLGLAPAGTTLSNGYLLVDTSRSPGNGIVNQTIQFHGAANLHSLNGAQALATLYSTASAPTSNPAVTLFNVGAGKAAAFTYDLAASIVTTRQGNPAWATQERDGFSPIRSDDKFYGNAAGDVQTDWIDLNKLAIPQADEQQRLLANLILHMNAGKKPLPRFWYFPNGKKAVVVMSGDDHGNGATTARFDQFKSASPAGCSVLNWECVRGTSYIYTSTPISNALAAQYDAEGFEIGLHINTGCGNFDALSLDSFYAQQVPDWKAKYTSLPAPITQRHHCIAWSDWTTGADVQFNYGMRLDTSYYFWPPSWVGNVPGLFTGSAMPMRFARLDGSLVDVYQAATQMTDESAQTYPFTVVTLLDRAVGSEGYFGVYTVNAHTDVPGSVEADTVVASAVARGVPVVSARQMLTWLDARNASSFDNLSWNGSALAFSITRDVAANGLKAMLPLQSGTAVLSSLTRAGVPVSYSASSIKGVEYAFFTADPGAYVATYSGDVTAPQVVATTPAAGATGVGPTLRPTVIFSEAMDPASLNSNTFELRDSSNALVPATVSYDSATRTATLAPSGALGALANYSLSLRGGATAPVVKDAAGNALANALTWSFTTGVAVPPPTCPCSGFGSTATPANASVFDPSAVELGVKFRSDVAGYITGIRFYKGSGNTGTHVGSLWTSGGALLASATFTSETASGWQQVDFAIPVAIAANVVYVASYFAPNGNYAADSYFFENNGTDSPPVHLLKDGISGGNGLYAYGAASTFPTASFRSTNYWVDVVFSNTGPSDTTPPTITNTVPANGAAGVAVGGAVTVSFSEPMDTSSLNTNTFVLRTAANAVVPAVVTHNSATNSATLTPSAALTPQSTYTVTLRGGASSAADPRAKDLAGNAVASTQTWTFTTGIAGGSCAAPSNAVVAENCLTGNPASEWDVAAAGDLSIQGYATDISVQRGNTVSFKVNTTAAAYRFDIYRMGYYGGAGARKVASVLPTASLPQSQAACLNDGATGLIDCGNWAVSGSWAVPATAVSGIYFARLQRTDTGGASHIVFVVRDDASTSHLLFQTADTTWQAYNNYGGNSLYTGSPAGRAYKVSYNRPFNTRAVDGGQDWVFNSEYPMVRWLEANGYDVSYTTGVDMDRAGALLQNHRVFLSVGHDEYWSAAQRSNVEAARNAGVNLAFFSGNEIFWKTRWEPSIDGSAAAHRTLVTYKETLANAKIDPSTSWTGTWRDPRFSPPADGGRPENALSGTIFMVNNGATSSIKVPEADGKMRFWRNTSVATLAAGTTTTLASDTLGYEWNVDADNGARPPGLMRLSTTTVNNAPVLQDYGSTYANGTATHSLTLYKHSSGARVFGAGTVQWAWGLDATHDRSGTPSDARMQQATVNLFADMGAQPATLQAGLQAATASSDVTAPVSTITAPAAGATVNAGSSVTISGTASDAGGGVVGAVEVSVDGGTTWRPATGRSSWSFVWQPGAAGTTQIKTRAVDDSGNLEVPGAGISVTAAPQACPCTIWPASTVPTVTADSDTGSVNLGLKFTAEQNGFVTGVRFYKGVGNSGTHIGSLWSSTGTLLASVTFTSETASGWQQADFAAPVSVTAGTVYTVSYLAPNGRYAVDSAYFTNAAFDNPPLRALQSSGSGGNGVFAYAATNTFPASSYNASNYWVDVVFNNTGPVDTTPPTVTATSPVAGATGVALSANISATFSEALNPATMNAASFELRDSANALVPSTVGFDPVTRVATLDPTPTLATSTLYTVTVRGGSTDPRVKDLAGNALAANQVWSFTTAADTTAPTITTFSPAAGATGVIGTADVTATFDEAMDATTLSNSTFELRDAANALVPSVVTYNATTRVLTLNPTPTLTPAGVYTATVRGGASDPRAKDVAGNALAANQVWSFTVLPDTTPPSVTTTSPTAGAIGISGTANVTATFSEVMDAATINATTVELRDAANALVASVVTYNATTRVVTLNPTPTLNPAGVYTATVRGGATDPRVKDAAGNALAANQVWSFTIVPDTTPPTITARTPAINAIGFARTGNITVTFSEAMNATSISASSFELRGPGNVLVPAVVTYNATNRVATLNPTPTLNVLTTYTVTVKGGATDPRVKDVAGNALAANLTWSFLTGL
jgi:hypothetical protein